LKTYTCKLIYGIDIYSCSLSISVVLLTATVSELRDWTTGYENKQTNYKKEIGGDVYIIYVSPLRSRSVVL